MEGIRSEISIGDLEIGLIPSLIQTQGEVENYRSKHVEPKLNIANMIIQTATSTAAMTLLGR
jgi:hypothetical protein